MKRLLLFLLIVGSAHAAGSVTQNFQVLSQTATGQVNAAVVSLYWTGDSITGTVPNTNLQNLACCIGYFVSQVETVPGSPSPTNLYGVAIQDSSGVDVLNGTALGLSNVNPASFAAAASAPPIQGQLTLVISSQSVASAKGTVFVFIQRPGFVNTATLNNSTVVPISRGGTGQITQPNALTAILGSSQVPAANGGTGAASPSAHTVPVAEGSSPFAFASPGVAQQVLASNGASADPTFQPASSILPSGTQTQSLRLKPNTGNNTTLQFVSPAYLNVNDYNFPAQTPGGSISIGSNTVTLTPCPNGLNGTDTNHYVYLSSGTGTAEAVLITSGTCTTGLSTGTIVFTAANTHTGAWTVTSATAGIKEALVTALANQTGVYIPTGVYSVFSSIYNDKSYNVSGQAITPAIWGDGPASDIHFQVSGTGFVIGNTTTQSNTYVSGIRATYTAGGFDTVGDQFLFRNIGELHAINLEANFGFNGFHFTDVQGHLDSNLFATVGAGKAFWFATGSNSVGNSGYLVNIQGTTQSNGIALELDPSINGLTFNNFGFEPVSGATGATCIKIAPNAAVGPINELLMEGGFADACDSSLLTTYATGAVESAQNTIHITNVRFSNSTTPAGPVISINAQMLGFKFNNCTFINTSTSGSFQDGITLSGIKNSTFSNNHIITNGTSARSIVIQQGAGSENVTDVIFSGNIIGFQGSNSPATTLATDAGAHTGVRFVANKFNIAPGWSATGGTNNYFGPDNQGLPIPAIASAATIALPVFPNFTMTGAVGITAVTSQTSAGASGFFVPSGAASFTAGASIGASCTVTANKTYSWYWDGTKVWVAGSGC